MKTGSEQPDLPIWAASKAKKQVDILKEVARSLAASELEQAKRSLASLNQNGLEAEQFRLEEHLDEETITVEEFRRLREIDFYLREMHQRRNFHPAHHERKPESLSD